MNLILRNIEAGAATEVTRADPSPSDPSRRAARLSRVYRVTFEAGRPGVSAAFVVDIGWDSRHGETECPVEDLETVGRSVIREFASRLALPDRS
jgi:hypothetical protein